MSTSHNRGPPAAWQGPQDIQVRISKQPIQQTASHTEIRTLPDLPPHVPRRCRIQPRSRIFSCALDTEHGARTATLPLCPPSLPVRTERASAETSLPKVQLPVPILRSRPRATWFASSFPFGTSANAVGRVMLRVSTEDRLTQVSLNLLPGSPLVGGLHQPRADYYRVVGIQACILTHVAIHVVSDSGCQPIGVSVKPPMT